MKLATVSSVELNSFITSGTAGAIIDDASGVRKVTKEICTLSQNSSGHRNQRFEGSETYYRNVSSRFLARPIHGLLGIVGAIPINNIGIGRDCRVSWRLFIGDVGARDDLCTLFDVDII
jgi:hypothetical protein